jgi:hypothetical protein
MADKKKSKRTFKGRIKDAMEEDLDAAASEQPRKDEEIDAKKKALEEYREKIKEEGMEESGTVYKYKYKKKRKPASKE